MTLSPLVVHVEKHGSTLDSLMSELRDWLDRHKIQPAEFRKLPADGAIVAFAVRFRNEFEAKLFRSEFI